MKIPIDEPVTDSMCARRMTFLALGESFKKFCSGASPHFSRAMVFGLVGGFFLLE